MITATKNSSGHHGFTLIELLITITVLAVIAALVIPSVRIISKDRQSREAARFVGSAFAGARSQAIVDGFSGIWIERNTNLQNGNASTRIYRVRAPLPFSGYGSGATADVDPLNNMASIPAIYVDPTDEFALIKPNDFVQFNHRGPLYRIVLVQPDPNPARTLVTFEPKVVDPPLPPAVAGPTLPMAFTIFRRPVKIPSTATELPRGFMIDLVASGHGSAGTQFNDPTATLALPAESEIVITFNANGELDTIYEMGLDDVSIFNTVIPEGHLYLLIAENDVETGKSTLDNKNNLWVTVNRTSGVTSINNMGDPAVGSLTPLENARSIARSGRSAVQ